MIMNIDENFIKYLNNIAKFLFKIVRKMKAEKRSNQSAFA